MKIDIFCHILPQAYFDRMTQLATRGAYMQKRVREIPVLLDLEQRFRVMDEFGDYSQVFSLATPAIEAFAGPDEAPEIATIANDGMAAIAAKHPDRFPGFAAALPMNNPEAAVREIERVLPMGARGIQIHTNINGRPLDDPAFLPIFEQMANADLPIWIHPNRGASSADRRAPATIHRGLPRDSARPPKRNHSPRHQALEHPRHAPR